MKRAIVWGGPCRFMRNFAAIAMGLVVVACGSSGKSGNGSTFSISGTVTGAEGAIITLSGDAAGSKTTGADGRYTFSNLAAGSYTVTPSFATYKFDPTSAPVTLTDADAGNVNFVARSTDLKEFQVGGDPIFIVPGDDNTLWFTECNANKIGRITTDGQLTEYPVPTANSCPYGILYMNLLGGGTVVFTERDSNKIGWLTSVNGQVQLFDKEIPSKGGSPVAITLDAFNHTLVWFTESSDPTNYTDDDKIGSFDIGDKSFPQFYSLYSRGSHLAGIATWFDATSEEIWFTKPYSSQGLIGRKDPASGPREECDVPSAEAEPSWIIVQNNEIWFTETAGGIGYLQRPDRNKACDTWGITEYTKLSSSSEPAGLVLGSCGSTGGTCLWFAENGSGKLASIDIVNGSFSDITEYSIGGNPFGITFGSDGNIWFTKPMAGKVGRFPPP